jgi:subtilase family serine protease
MKHIPSGYQVNFSHVLQAERNEQFTRHSFIFYAGWGKMYLFAITLLLIQLSMAQFQNGKKNDTLLRYMYQESALSMIISLKHFLFSAE